MGGREMPHNRRLAWVLGSTGLSMMKEAAFFESYLTIGDVERATGLQNVKQISSHPSKFLGGDLNFVNTEGSKVLCVVFSKANQFETYRSMMPKDLIIAVKGVGEEAFAGLSTADRSTQFLVFRKGDHMVYLIAAASAGERNNGLTLGQLVAIGKIMTARLA
jgi:hypothetical protein